MTVSFADQFDIPQFSKKYSVILKRPRSYVLTRFLWFRTFVHGNASVPAVVVQPASCCVSVV